MNGFDFELVPLFALNDFTNSFFGNINDQSQSYNCWNDPNGPITLVRKTVATSTDDLPGSQALQARWRRNKRGSDSDLESNYSCDEGRGDRGFHRGKPIPSIFGKGKILSATPITQRKLKDLLCRSLLISRKEERPSTVPFGELNEDARHILRGKFLPRGYVPPTNVKSQSIRIPVRLPRKKRICLVGSRYEVLPAVASDLGFEIVNENDLWNINWSDSPMPQDKICQMRRIQDMYSVFWGNNAPLQKTNHFPGMYEICRKDRLGRNLNRLRRMFPNEFNFFPETWDLPTEQTDLIAFARRRRNATYIVKPEAGCQGKGIFLLRNPKKLSPFTKCVCQVYIPHPFLIDGYKFDQRIYVLITCVDPLRVYIYEEGIARFATVKYETPTDENLEVVFMHLTNYSLNKFSESYVREGDGSKRKVSAVYKWMAEKGCDIPKLTEAIDEIIVKTLLCAAPTLKHNYRTCFPKKDRGCSCFELLGFDILIDRNLKPILLEVNHSPSFNLDLPVDGEVKTALLKDMFNMVYLGDELNSAASKQKRKCFRKSRKNSDDSSGSASRKKKRPTSPVVEESFENLSKPLRKQFQHELKRKGNFRLIYSSDKPGRFASMMDDNYCGYQTLTGPVNQSAEPSQAISESKPIKKKYYHPFSFDSEHEVGKRRQGQPYLEPSLTNALLSRSNLPAAPSRNVIQSRFREAHHHGSSLSLTMNQRGIITRTFCKKPDPPGQDKRGAKVESKKSINIMNTSMINKNKSKSFGHGEMGETEEKCQIFYDNKNYNRR